jgi:hypothetical protein
MPASLRGFDDRRPLACPAGLRASLPQAQDRPERYRGSLRFETVPAKRSRATTLDCRHDASLCEVYVSSVGRAPSLAVTAKNIGYLQPSTAVGVACDFSSLPTRGRQRERVRDVEGMV